MGVTLSLNLSKSISVDEWDKVYAISLKMAKEFKLADFDKVDMKGMPIVCIVPTVEKKERAIWEYYKECWVAVGDSYWLKTAEPYRLPKKLASIGNYEENAGDVLLSLVPYNVDSESIEDDSQFKNAFVLWGNKTQGEPYHMSLLAIACMIEHYLGDKAIVDGCITRGQCKRAAEMASEFLGENVKPPVTCDINRLLPRVLQLPLTSAQQLEFLEKVYLGQKDETYFNSLNSTYTEADWQAYWKNKFANKCVNSFGFFEDLKKYMEYGFKLEDLFKYIEINKDSDCEALAKVIMNGGIYLPQKSFDDAITIDEDDEHSYGVEQQLAQFFFMGARNKKINSYIPLNEIKTILKNAYGKLFDFDKYIDSYLEEKSKGNEKDLVTKYKEAKDKMIEKEQQLRENYDIVYVEELLHYKKGNTITPLLCRDLKNLKKFITDRWEDEHYKQLMTESAQERWCFEASQGDRYSLLLENWEHICDETFNNPNSFARYYPLCTLSIREYQVERIAMAMITNDELYEYVMQLEE